MKKQTVHPLPLTYASYDELYGAWQRMVKTPESGSMYYHNKSDLLYRIHQLRTDSRLKNRYLKETMLHVIDVESENIEDPEGWEDRLSSITNNPNTLIVILGMDHHLIRGDTWVFHYLMQKEIEYGNSAFLMVFTLDFLHPNYRAVFDSASTWIRRTIFTPLHTHADTLAYLKHQSSLWHMRLTPSRLQELADLTQGGYFLLPKEALRQSRDEPNITIPAIFSSREMHLRVESIWQQLLHSEQEVMKKIICRKKLGNPTETHSLDFLTRTGWLNYFSGRPKIAIPLLEKYLHTLTSHVELEYNDNHKLTLSGIPIDGQLTNAEKQLLKILVQNKGSLVRRDHIASLLGNQGPYSDWSIDKTVSRLRHKFAALEINPALIKTVHGHGFVLNLSQKG